jgi:hypothetical protein
MRLNPPKKVTFWVAIAIAALSAVAYTVHVISRTIPFLGAVGYVLMAAAFALICLGLIIKGL